MIELALTPATVRAVVVLILLALLTQSCRPENGTLAGAAVHWLDSRSCPAPQPGAR